MPARYDSLRFSGKNRGAVDCYKYPPGYLV
jgi:hypothetical protein